MLTLLRPPGVYRPQHDTEMLASAISRHFPVEGSRVLDICTGTGAVAIAAAKAGAASVTAVDLSARSAVAAWCNTQVRRLPVTVRRGDLLAPVRGQEFDLVVANPPYVPSMGSRLPRHRQARCWDGGIDGRAVIDRICRGVGEVLAPGGMLLLVHSALCGEDATIARLHESGMRAEVLDRSTQPFGPVLAARAVMLERRGLIQVGERTEGLVLVGARRG